MRAVTAAEMREMDRAAIEDYGIPGPVLMENAGRHVAEAGCQLLGRVRGKSVVIIAGKGNNGGDGFVAARHLRNRGAAVRVYLAADTSEIKGDAALNLDIWLTMGGTVVNALRAGEELQEELARADLVIDALYGTGFKGTVRSYMEPVINAVNAAAAPVLAVDIPSGLEADTGKVNGPCIRAVQTVTFALPKIGLLTGDGPEYTGDLEPVDISIPAALLKDGDKEIITAALVNRLLPSRKKTAHKGNFGHALVAGGSPGMSGAVCLAASACARSGAGLVTAAVPGCIHAVAENKLTEVMTRAMPETGDGLLAAGGAEIIRDMAQKAGALAIGPGLGVSGDTVKLVEALLDLPVPCIIDADGLNALARSDPGLKGLRGNAVITPHPGEMARLLGCSPAGIEADRPGSARRAAEESGAVVVLKGAGTLVAIPGGRTYINTSGNPGMASGGSGDVLTGIIAGLAAQGLSPEDAAVAGVYLHGLAGDLAAEEKGKAGLLAGDMVNAVSNAVRLIAGEE